MDSRIGLDYIVENREYVSKLGTALDTQNVTVKKQVFELLSALCAYSNEGYARAIETLEFFKNLKNERYRFQIVINELEKATNVEYQVALLAFINCVIISAASLQDRIRIRNEFIGVRVLPTLTNLRKVAQSVGDIVVQLDVFEEQRECDEAQSLQGPNGINLNSHLDVFYAILRQVADTPQEVPFLSILQHLLRIEPKEAVSDVIWDTAEKLVHRATLLENQEDSVRLLRTTNAQKYTCPHCRGDATSPSRKQAGISNIGNGPLSPVPVHATKSTSSAQQLSKQSMPPPPPPPPPPPQQHQQQSTEPTQIYSNAVVPPPPPPLFMLNAGAPPPPVPPVPPPIPGIGVPSSLLPNNLLANSSQHLHSTSTESTSLPDLHVVRLPQQETPAPKSKMKTLNWGKIPPNKVIGKQNIWTIVANEHQGSPKAAIDWTEMEGLFCLQANASQGSPKLGRAGYDTTDRKSKKENMEITLLDGKRSLNVNIFLKQFRSSNEAIMELICQGAHNEFGAEKLRGLLKLLPEVDELDLLKLFNGDKARLGNAEKFLLQLLEVSNYKLRIESMLLKAEFSANIEYLDPCINSMIYAGEDLINNKMLQEVLYVVLVAGNFLNSGGYAGNAAGVKLTSLQKLTDIRANKPGMNLIHFVAMQVEKRNPELVKFPAQLSALESATKTSSEQITNEINALDGRIRVIRQQVELATTDTDIKLQMGEFLQSAEREILVLKGGMKEVETMRLKLAEFFCEDPAAFKLEECYKIFYNFCDKFKRAVLENDRRKHQEAQATLRRKQREEQLTKKTKQANASTTPNSDIDSPSLLDSTFDARASPALQRRRVGSLNNGIDQSNGFIRMESHDGMSPDITPNGSLRRRRSRVLAEEDELMEFLRSSAGYDHNSRERKAYGSLDRSWARRNRSSSSSRKRPDILTLDFGNERERASSPGPLLHQDKHSPIAPQATGDATPQSHEEAKPRISREWRQKIETWLQSNENDEKQNEEYKRKRRLVNSNRRSLENDPDNERKLDTLEEEKTVPTPNTHPKDNIPTNHKTNNIEKYERVYPEWKPSKALEQTDIVGTLQAIAAVNNQNEQNQLQKQTKDNSKELLNNNNNNNSNANNNNNNNNTNNTNNNNNNNSADPTNNCKTIEDLRQYRKQRSLENNEKHNNQLHAIEEEDRRKILLHQLADNPPKDHLEIYVRKAIGKEHKEPKSRTVDKANDPAPTTSTSINPATSTPPTTTTTTTPSTTSDIAAIALTKTASYTKVSMDSPKSPTNSQSNLSKTLIVPEDKPKTDDTFASLLDHHKCHNEQYSRKEIDADNIETPPVMRRVIASPTSTIIKVNITNDLTNMAAADNESTQVQPGTFDRHSLVRRTRRYKRSTDTSSGNEDQALSRESSNTHSPLPTHKNRKLNSNNHDDNVAPSPKHATSNNIAAHSPATNSSITSSPSAVTASRTPSLQKTMHKVEKLGRHISSINQEDVREAIRNLKSPTSTPERIWSPPRDVITQQPTRDHTTTMINGMAATKLSTHELNDEGFEETQSLVSDSASHGKGESTTSSCNEANEVQVTKHPITSNARQLLNHNNNRTPRHATKAPTATTAHSRSKSQAPQPSNSLAIPTAAERRANSTTRPSMRLPQNTQGIRHAASAATIPYNSSNSASMRRTESARKVNDKSALKQPEPSARRNIELTSSRNSLSSRSSINSGASTNTVVRRAPIVNKSPLLNNSADTSPAKRPLAMHNTTTMMPNPRIKSVPASRSSSSGSSVGANIVVVRHHNINNNKLTTNYHHRPTAVGHSSASMVNNENQAQSNKPRVGATRSALLVKAAIENFTKTGKPETTVAPTTTTTSNASGHKLKTQSQTRGLSSFMRPTASSATKRNK